MYDLTKDRQNQFPSPSPPKKPQKTKGKYEPVKNETINL